jgi:hypothetical protein
MKLSTSSIFCSVLCLAATIHAAPVQNGDHRGLKVESKRQARSVKGLGSSQFRSDSLGMRPQVRDYADDHVDLLIIIDLFRRQAQSESETDELIDFLEGLGQGGRESSSVAASTSSITSAGPQAQPTQSTLVRTSTTLLSSSSQTTSLPSSSVSIATPSSTSTADSATSPLPTLSLPPSLATNPNNSSSHPRLVFAHFMVGIVSTYQPSNWERDMNLAKSYGIDGFALNVGKDSYTESQLKMAYDAAAKVGFEVFISFDVSQEGEIEISPWDGGQGR